MNDTRWRDVLFSVDSAVRHFREALELYDEGGLGEGDRTARRNEMAFMHVMQAGYTSFESALVRTMTILGEDKPTGPDWHKQLVERSASDIPGLRPPILPRAALPLARKVRSFRHWAMHGYDEPFDPQEAGVAVKAARELAEILRPTIEAFAQAVDP